MEKTLMVSWWWFLVAIPVFGLLVVVHELGHFLTAKWAGIRVEEFGIGFPPRLFGIKRGETIYSLNLLPIGGFVRMPGENGEMTDENGAYDPRTFAAKPASKRLIVLLAGVTMNVILAFVLLVSMEVIGGRNPDGIPATIASVVDGSPAAQAGIKSGDRILTVNGKPVANFTDFRNAVSDITDSTPKDATTVPVTVTVQHAGQSQPVTLTVNALAHPGICSQQGHFGVTADTSNAPWAATPFWEAPYKGLQDMGLVTVATGQFLGQIIQGAAPVAQCVSGPVGIVKQTGDTASETPTQGPGPVLFLTALLSLNLAFVNALPVPALDGGRVLLIIIEVLRRGKRLSPEREGMINLAGMALLLLLMLVVTFNDITHLGR
jgi:regulator of sigma E protease